MQGVGLAGNRCLPSDLTELAKDYKRVWDINNENKVRQHETTMLKMESYQEVIQTHAALQDACPVLFAHKSDEEAMETIEQLDLLNGRGLPKGTDEPVKTRRNPPVRFPLRYRGGGCGGIQGPRQWLTFTT